MPKHLDRELNRYHFLCKIILIMKHASGVQFPPNRNNWLCTIKEHLTVARFSVNLEIYILDRELYRGALAAGCYS